MSAAFRFIQGRLKSRQISFENVCWELVISPQRLFTSDQRANTNSCLCQRKVKRWPFFSHFVHWLETSRYWVTRHYQFVIVSVQGVANRHHYNCLLNYCPWADHPGISSRIVKNETVTISHDWCYFRMGVNSSLELRDDLASVIRSCSLPKVIHQNCFYLLPT